MNIDKIEFVPRASSKRDQFSEAAFSKTINSLIDTTGNGLDKRKLKSWINSDKENVLFWGDSTTEQLHGLGLVKYTGEYSLTFINPDITTATRMYNYGANGRTLESVMVGGEDLNSGGLNVKINSILDFATNNPNSLYVISFGINDCRQDITIAGSSYGDASQVSKANELRTLLLSAVEQITSVDTQASFILRMPNQHHDTSTYLLNGVTGQNCMDVYQLTYRGDVSLGIPSIDDGLENVLLSDTLYNVYNNTTNNNSNLVHPDGLHPSSSGYTNELSILLRLIAQATGELSNTNQASIKIADEQLISKSSHYIEDITLLRNSSNIEIIDTVFVVNTGSFLDLRFSDNDIAWGGGIGSGYGSADSPAFCYDDIIYMIADDGEELFIRVGRMADANNGSYLRWFSGSPKGSYPDAKFKDTYALVLRNNVVGSNRALVNRDRLKGVGVTRALAGEAHLFNMTSVSDGSCTIARVKGESSDLENIVVTTTDQMVCLGVTDEDDFYKGLSLSGATITAGSNPNSYNISLAGYDFREALIRQCIIIIKQ